MSPPRAPRLTYNTRYTNPIVPFLSPVPLCLVRLQVLPGTLEGAPLARGQPILVLPLMQLLEVILEVQ